MALITISRGFGRGSSVDIGAFQTQVFPFLVTTASDPGGLAGLLSLREAVNLANAYANAGYPADITFVAGVTDIVLDGSQLELSGRTQYANSPATISIYGGGLVTVDGNNASRVFLVDAGAQAVLMGLVIQDGNAGDLSLGSFSAGQGGAIYNLGLLTVTDSTLSGNSASFGGGIGNYGELELDGCTLSDNTASDYGGGIFNDNLLTMSNCTLSGNTTSGYGGGIFNYVEPNPAGSGMTLGTLIVNDSTLSNNSALDSGGGIDNDGTSAKLNNTIVAGNTADGTGPDIDGAVAASSANNLIGNGSGMSGIANNDANQNQVGSGSPALNPKLAPLGSYGGPTQTMAPLPGSPAIGKGSVKLAVDARGFPLATDQRGYPHPRTINSTVDVGAVETDGQSTLPGLIQQALSPSSPVTIQVTPATADEVVLAIATVTVPQGQADSVYLNLAPGTYDSQTVSVPSGMTLYISGAPGTTIDPASPAFTVASGNVVVSNVTFVTTGDAPTILVSGGSLTLTNDDVVQASTTFTQPAIAVTGGTVNLGTASSPGNNTLSVSSSGDLVSNSSGNAISAVGDTFVVGGTVLPAASLSFTSLTTRAASVIPGQPVMFTATVAANGSGTPTGSVDFLDTTTGTDLGTATLSGGVASLTTSALALGTHVIQASYSGDSNFLPSLASLTQTVTQSIFILNATASGALSVSGNASLTIPGYVVVDSSSKTALIESGNAQVSAASISVVGGVQESGNAKLSPAPVTGAASVPDPLAGLSVPSMTGSRTTVSVTGNWSLTINPGIYTSITVSGNGKLTMTAGIYVIAGGGFAVSGNGIVSGSGVMIYNAGSAYPNPGGSFGSISFSGNTTVNLSAPTSGPYAGVLIFQSRDNYRALALSGNASASGGTIYAASAALVLSGNANVTHLTAVVSTLSVSGGAFQLADGATSDYVSSTSNQILFGVLTVAVQDDTGAGLDPNEVCEINDAMSYLNDALGSFGVYLSWAAPGTVADVHIHFAASTPYGGASDGVLGFTTASNDVYFVTTGWNFYTGADPSQIGAGQYDFLTLATHELAHTVGLGESSDPASVMYEYLAPGTVRRTFTDSNLALINTDADRFMKAALPIVHGSPMLPGQATSLSAFWQGSALLLDHAGTSPFGGMPFPASLNPQTNGHVATTPGFDGSDEVLVGGSGNDLVIGGQGRNLMAGGFGVDQLAKDRAEGSDPRLDFDVFVNDLGLNP